MISPCSPDNHQYNLFNSVLFPNKKAYNGNRYSVPYIKPTPEMYQQHKTLILKHTTLTNGPGIINEITTPQLKYKLNVDSVQYNNVIYRIPCRFRPYLTEIKDLLPTSTIKQIFEYLTITYNIPDTSLQTDSVYQFKRLYTYGGFNDSGVQKRTDTINLVTTFQTGKIVDLTNNPILQVTPWSTILPNIPLTYFVMKQYCQFIKADNNDGNSFSNDVVNLGIQGNASYVGSSFVPFNQNLVFKTFVLIEPQTQTDLPSYGYLVSTTAIPQLGASGIPINLILFIPIQNYTSIISYNPYPENLNFNIKATPTVPEAVNTIKCKYSQYDTNLA